MDTILHFIFYPIVDIKHVYFINRGSLNWMTQYMRTQ